jgi:hypothetical protein
MDTTGGRSPLFDAPHRARHVDLRRLALARVVSLFIASSATRTSLMYSEVRLAVRRLYFAAFGLLRLGTLYRERYLERILG